MSTFRIERVEGSTMPVNSYVIDAPEGLIVVDGQLTVGDARSVRSVIDGFDRPVAAMILTHGHPDHYAGAATVLEGLSAPIIATRAVANVIRRDDDEKDEIVGPMMGPEWPKVRRFPDDVVEAGETHTVGGLEFSLRDLGPGESHADTIWALDDGTVFSGDVAYNDMHAYLADGHLAEWLRTLSRLEAELDGTVTLFVGHGEPADRSALVRQREYLNVFVDAVWAAADEDEQGRHDAVVAQMKKLVRDDRLLFLMELSIEPTLTQLRESQSADLGGAAS